MEIRRGLMMQIGDGDMELIAKMVIPDSRENDTNGNANAIFSEYVWPNIYEYQTIDIFCLVADNNTAQMYALRKAVWIGNNSSFTASTGTILRQNANSMYSVRSISSSTSAWCSAGTILKLYRLKGA